MATRAKNERLGRYSYEMHVVRGKSWTQHSPLAAVACGDRAAFVFREGFLVKKIE